MRIWVDLVNSPQVLVLQPVIRELCRRGHEVVVTTRDFAQTTQLADGFGLSHVALGRHGGSSRVRALTYNIERVRILRNFARQQKIDLALSHNSYSQGLAARMLGIPFVTMMDYEHHRANHLAFRLARRVLVPSVFPEPALRGFGAADRAVRYPGLKEELYLADFQKSADFLAKAGIPPAQTLVVLRPPATWAVYYRGRGRLFDAVVERLGTKDKAFVVYLPRVVDQVRLVGRLPEDRVLIPNKALDGPDLLAHADVVISGGGTMIREAAVLGTPAYSIFEGKLGAVDTRLMEEGRLHWVRNSSDMDLIRIVPKTNVQCRQAQPGLVAFVTDAILEAA